MTWLDSDQVLAVLGGDLAANLDTDKLEEACTGTRSFVEGKRPDLWVSDGEDPPVLTYTPTPSVIYGAALFAHRLYHRTRTPLGTITTNTETSGILREDPDIARMLGIGRARRFRFGGARPAVVEVV